MRPSVHLSLSITQNDVGETKPLAKHLRKFETFIEIIRIRMYQIYIVSRFMDTLGQKCLILLNEY